MSNLDKVILKDFEVLAKHGVNPEEKENAQRFVVTAQLYLDVEQASKNDDLNKTISYSAVKKEIKSFFEQNCFDLIETLAVRTAYLLLKTFSLAKSVDVTVKKPDAPMSGTFDYAGVSVSRAWHRVYLSIGSSIGDRDEYLDFAVKRLRADDNIKGVVESGRYHTEPYGCVAKNEFVNSAVQLDTLYSPQELLRIVNDIEKDGDRVRDKHWDDRTLDIDIIFYDDEIVQDSNLCIPHVDMQNRDFVLRPLYELCPYKLHPVLNKRVFEMLRDLPMLL